MQQKHLSEKLTFEYTMDLKIVQTSSILELLNQGNSSDKFYTGIIKSR